MIQTKWIALSGAVPFQDELIAHGWSELGIKTFVRRFVDRVMRAGGGITMGSHPTFLDIIHEVAELHTLTAGPKRWRIWVGKRFIPEDQERAEYEQKYGRLAEITWVGELDGPEPVSEKRAIELRQIVLTELRTKFIKASGALVCVGGRPTRKDKQGKIIALAGVEEESAIAWKNKRPLYFVGAGGGAAEGVYRKAFRKKLTQKTNGLNPDLNELIATHKDPSLAVSYVIEGLQNIKAL
jgi:hypothetical protein